MADPEKIGKYRILERIGRGGMGMIFKAHDPILNRPVALKVISTDIDVTDEIRARFFREAQACARLSHPNIVTVHDMGEDSGRMFIVMELLEGVELRRLIADRAPLALEEKLSIMAQVCDGLAYAHQHGIIHRDIKPGNIMRLRSGQVKILDFGIAQMENVQEALTRTGLIMGTLRYMAPEQIRGRADHRTDIFAVGAVFYEFLSWRPPFDASDVLQLIEQLRAEDPPPLHVLDPTIPPELSAIVAGAMRKDVAERVADLAQMRAQIEHVQHALADEARRAKERVRARREELCRLEAALASRVGPGNEAPTATTGEPRALAALRALESDLADRMEATRALLARADAVDPAFARGSALLEAGRFADAVAQFESVLADMPEHARAAGSLARARAGAEAQERGPLVTDAVEDARTVIAGVEHAPATVPGGAISDASGDAGVAMHREPAPAREPLEDDRTRVEEAWDRTPAAGAPSGSPGERDAAGTSRATPRSPERPPRSESPQHVAAPSERVSAEPRGSRRPSPGRWILAGVGGLAAVVLVVAYSLSPHAPPTSPRPSPAPSGSPSAASPSAVSPPAAPSGSPTAISPPAVSPPATPPGTSTGAPAHRSVQGDEPVRAGASQAPSQHAEVASAQARAAEAARTQPDRATPPPSGRADQHEAEGASVQARRDAEQAGTQASSTRRAAEHAGAPFYTPKLWASAQAKEREGTAALRRSDYAVATRLLGQAQSEYQHAAQESQREADVEQQVAPLRAKVDQARGAALAQRRQALAAGAEQRAPDLLRTAEAKHAEADGLAARQSFAEAARAYEQAAQRYGEAALRAQAPSSGK